MDLYGATSEDFAQVKVKNSRHGLANPNARFRKETTVDDVLNSPVVSDPLRLLDICATSDGGAALVVASADWAKRRLGSLDGVPRIRAVSTVTPTYPQSMLELPDIATDSTAVVPAPELGFKDSIAHAAYEEAGIGPEDLSLAEVYDLSTALELDWYEHIGLCKRGRRRGAAAVGRHLDRRPHPGEHLGRPGVASARRFPPRRSPRCASSHGSCAARPASGRSTVPPWASPPTRACSATARPSSSPAESA